MIGRGRRRLGAAGLLVLAATLAGCGDDTPPPEVFATPDYGYLTKLRLNVATISVDDGRAPAAVGGLAHVETLSPVTPFEGLQRLASDRLVAGGNSGQARFVIEDASIVQGPGRLDGSLAVRLDVQTTGGTRSGFAEARVVRSQGGGPDDPDGGRGAAYRLTKAMLDDMNVELEYQVRHNLRGYLQMTEPAAAPGGPVQRQDLPPPPGVTLAPPPPPAGS